MAVTGVKKAYLAALESNRELHIFELERDEDEIKALMEAERYFWDNYVKTCTPPPADGHRATTETVGKMYPDDNGDDVDLTDIAEDFAQRKRLKESRNAIDAQMDEIDNRIKLRMGEASKGTAGLFSASWKVQTRNSFDAEALKADYPEIDLSKYTRSTQSRVFRVTEKKRHTAHKEQIKDRRIEDRPDDCLCGCHQLRTLNDLRNRDGVRQCRILYKGNDFIGHRRQNALDDLLQNDLAEDLSFGQTQHIAGFILPLGD
jgi:hypothetical protein